MERKLLTAAEIAGLDDIIPYDKGLIEEAVKEHGGGPAESQDTQLRMALRGYLARLFLDLVPDDKLRNEADGTAASFADGWEWCIEHGQ